jgi:hypothetical protein
MSEKRLTFGIASRRKTRARALANAREVPKPSRNELRDDSELAKLVKARRRERLVKITLDEL